MSKFRTEKIKTRSLRRLWLAILAVAPVIALAAPVEIKVLIIYTEDGRQKVQQGLGQTTAAHAAARIDALNDRMDDNALDDDVEFVAATTIIDTSFIYDENDASSQQPADSGSVGDFAEAAHDLNDSDSATVRHGGKTLAQLRAEHQADLVIVFGDLNTPPSGGWPPSGKPQGGASASGTAAGISSRYVVAVNVDDANSQTLAHEIGHLAKLVHENLVDGEYQVAQGIGVGTLMTGGFSCFFGNTQAPPVPPFNVGDPPCIAVSQYFSTISKNILKDTLPPMSGYFNYSGGGGGGGGGGGLPIPSPPDLQAIPYNCQQELPGYPPICEWEIYWYYDGWTEYVVFYNYGAPQGSLPAWWQPIHIPHSWSTFHITAAACNAENVCSGQSFPILLPTW